MQRTKSLQSTTDMVRTVPRLAWALAVLSIVLVLVAAVAILYYTFAGGDTSDLLAHLSLVAPVAVTFSIIGALVASRHPHNPIGWIFLTAGLLNALTIAARYSDVAPFLMAMGNPPGATLMDWLDVWIWQPAIVLPTVFVFFLFPDGRLPSPRWRVVFWAAGLGLALSVAELALHPGTSENWDVAGGNPFGLVWAAPALEVAGVVGQWLLALGLVGAIAAFIARLRRSRGIEREQMKWLAYALAVLVLGLIVGSVLSYGWPENAVIEKLTIALTSLTILGIGVAASIAILRHRLYDIDLVINRTLVYGLLTTSIISIYVLVVGGLGALFQARGNQVIALVATGLVAVLFQPLQERLQRGVNQLFYGRRDDPLGTLSQLGRRLEAAIAPEVVLPTLVETIARTLRLPYAAISLRTGEKFKIAAQTGDDTAETIRLPLISQGETVGQLIAGLRGQGESFSEADMRLLETIAHQAGPAVRAVQLTAELQHSRRQLVTTREEERRRLRRDLHDGLGATLAGLHLEAGALRRAMHTDPAKADALIDEFRADIRDAIDEIRRLVYELRPPTLDQLGLVAAVRAQAAACSRPIEKQGDESPETQLKIRVDAPEEFPPLPAAVEVAAYRIVQEGLTNVVRHAHAQHCHVRLDMADELQVEIIDDGEGVSNGRRRDNGGVGLLTMRERAIELGGTCVVEPAPDGGTRVFAALPVREATSVQTSVR